MAPFVWQEYKEKRCGHKTEMENKEHIVRNIMANGMDGLLHAFRLRVRILLKGTSS